MTGERPRGGGRRGFTMIELLMTLLVIAILAALAMPNLNQAITKARATEALGDLNTIKVAVLNYQADHSTWPPDRNRGIIPPGLEEYLPEGFSFTTEHYVLDYDNWSDTSAEFVAVTMITDDEQLGLQLLNLVGGNAWTDNSEKYTWVVEWTD